MAVPSASRPDLTWRAATADDEEFVLELTFVTMRGYLEASRGWDDEQIRKRLKYRNALYHWWIVSQDGVVRGAFAFGETAAQIHLQSIHILPEHQGCGIGTAVLKHVLDMADRKNLPILLEVLKTNPDAYRLYTRLGFRTLREDDRQFTLWRDSLPPNPSIEESSTPTRSPIARWLQRLRAFRRSS